MTLGVFSYYKVIINFKLYNNRTVDGSSTKTEANSPFVLTSSFQ